MKAKNRLLFSSLITVAFATSAAVHAADGTWSAAATGTWDTTDTNWTGVTPGTPWDSSNGPSNTAIFNDTTNATISGTVYAAGLTFGGATTTNTLTAGTLDFGSANAPINLTNNAKLTINSTLAGSGNLTFTSVANGDWDRGVTLGADNSSTFTGKMSFVKTAGNYFFVKVTSDLSFGAVPASFTADALTFNTVNFASNVTIAANRGINLAGTLNFTGGTQTINSVISGSGGLFIQGATVTLNAVNTYAGNTAGRQGTYNIGIDNALPHGAGKGVVNLDGRGVATLDLKGHELTVNALDFNNFNTFASTVDNTAAGTASLILGDGNGSGTLRTGSLIKNTGGALSMTKIGTGTQTFNTANTYNGNTTVNGGTLALGFTATVTTNILPTASALTLGGGTLQLTGTGTQTVAGLTTTANTASRILLAADETLTLGALASAGANSALNFNTVAGGANATTPAVGTSLVVLTGQTTGTAINSAFTVSDAGGFGLATVNGSDQVVRLTSGLNLLPASGAASTTDYHVDNNAGGAAAAGSSSLAVTASSSAKSITVDTTTASGSLTLNSGVVLSNNIWSFGQGAGTNTYMVTGNAGGAGLTSVASGDAIGFNNYNTGLVTIASPILANGASGVNINGTGKLKMSGANTYTGTTTLGSGTLEVGVGSVGSVGAITSSAVGTGLLALNGGTISSDSSTARTLLNAVTFGDNVIFGDGNSGALTFSANADLGGATRILTFSTNAQFDGVVSNGGLAKAGGSILTLTAANTYSLGTTLSAGTTRIGVDSVGSVGSITSSAVGTGTLTLIGGTLSSNSSTARTILNAVTIRGSVTLGNGTNNGKLTFSANADLFGAASTWTLNSDAQFDGVLNNGGLTKAGAGVLTLTAANSYTGATSVTLGTLSLVGGSQASAITVSSGAALGFTLGSPVTSTSTVTFSGATAKVTVSGTPVAATLMTTTAPSGITGTPVLDPAIPGYELAIEGGGTTLVLKAADNYNAWADDNAPGEAIGEDHDDDGVSNGVEYFMGLSGNGFTANPSPNATNVVSWPKGLSYTGVYGTDYAIQISSDLGISDDWTDVSVGDVTIDGDSVDYDLDTTPAGSKKFARLRVTGP